LPDPSGIPDAVPKVEPKSKYGNPESYVVFGKRYHTKSSSNGYVERGVASWYGPDFHGRKTSSGERYDMYAMTAAHKTLPLPTYARVTNVKNGRSAVVKINDRGPFHGDRIIDLSYSAARKLGVVAKGTAMVEVKAIDPRQPESKARNDLFAFADTGSAANTPTSERRTETPLTRPATTRPSAPVAAKKTLVAKAEAPWAARTPGRKTQVQVAKAEKPRAAAKEVPIRIAKLEKSQATSRGIPASSAKVSTPEPKVALAKAVASPRKGSRSSMYLQVGAFGSRANAEQLRRRLAQQIAEHVQIRSVDDQTTHWYKVHVGPLASKTTAKDLSQQLASLGLQGSHIVVE
jgi:rare lipoprotein A